MAEYALPGPQVEPEASYWLYCPHPCVVQIDDLRKLTDDPGSEHYFPPYPDEAVTRREYEELVDLSGKRDDPCALVHDAKCKDLPETCKQEKKLPGAFGCRRPISKLFNLTPPALGAVMVNRFPGEQIIRTGRGMARAIESETPGLFQRHALNYLIRLRNWSPPRQALVWAALDVAIASALNAAWYYKWLAVGRMQTARRERPIEWAKRNGKPLNVLFDRPDELNPAYNLCPDGRPKGGVWPDNASGTPRHPAYPSGHSTYSGAAGEILGFFFGAQQTPPELPSDPRLGSVPGTTLKQEIDYMTDNIGMGRLWAGIHWRSDHEAGIKLGRTVAQLVLQQIADIGSVGCKDGKAGKVKALNACGALPQMIDQCDFKAGTCKDTPIPTREELECEAYAIQKACGEHKNFDCPCPAPKTTHTAAALDYSRGVQSDQ